VVKIPTNNVSQLDEAAFRDWAPRLLGRLDAVQPRLACFHGVTGYRPFLRYALGVRREPVRLGRQPETLGGTLLYVVPNPSPANAHFTPADQTAWYDRVADVVDALKGG
jgi:TDG/mug DNA glycosylase family protein